MILADKLIQLRKRNGWTQEELAEKLDVSRQAVAKWEGAQTIPNLDKILQLGEVFGVTTDYLLKDEIETEEFIDSTADSPIRRVTLAQANAFLEWRKTAAVRIAAATFLCILSVIPLLVLGAATESFPHEISETFAGVVGLGALLILVAIAAAIFVLCGFQNAPYEFLDEEIFDIEYGVKGMVLEKQKAYKPTYVKYNILGTCIAILSPIPLFAGAFTENEFWMGMLLAVTLLLAGIGVMFFITAGIRWASMQKLLKEGDFTPQEKKKSKVRERIGAMYWLTATAVYLGWSFATDSWQKSWIVWPIAGILFAGIRMICNLLIDRES